MTVKEEHDQCIGRAFTQRKNARKKLKAIDQRLQQAGHWMETVGTRLGMFQRWDIQEEEGLLVFSRHASPQRRETEDHAVPLPTQEEIVRLVQTAYQLRQEIDELNGILGDEE